MDSLDAFNGCNMWRVCMVMWLSRLVLCAPIVVMETHLTDETKIPAGVEQLFYKVGQMYTFKCSNNLPESSVVHWYINGTAIEDDTNEWLATWFIHAVNVHLNEISLEALEDAGSVSTLMCKVDGDYANNIVNMYHLIDMSPSDKILGRHVKQQDCPLYTDKTLTLNCSPGLRFIEPHGWTWYRDEVPIGGETAGQIQVSSPGVYRCMYRKHKHNSKDLLTFNVASTHSASTSDVTWTFCSYSDNAPL